MGDHGFLNIFKNFQYVRYKILIFCEGTLSEWGWDLRLGVFLVAIPLSLLTTMFL